jgi:ABC-2 type transport system permease protein
VPAVAPKGGYFDVVSAITGPLSITEQFKNVSGAILGDTSATGDVTAGVIVLLASLAIMTLVVIATPRNFMRRGLNE